MNKSINLHRVAASRADNGQESPPPSPPARIDVASNRLEAQDLDNHLGGQSPAPTNDDPTLAGMTHRGRIRSTRVSAWWTGVITAAVLLVALLIFIAQNSHTVSVHYLGLQGQVSLAIALLLSAVAAVLVVAVPGTARILQLRHALKKNAHNTLSSPKSQ